MNSIDTYKKTITYKKIGVKCPNGYYYSFESNMCVYDITSSDAKNSLIDDPKHIVKPKTHKKPYKPKLEAINCVKAINFCGFNKGQ